MAERPFVHSDHQIFAAASKAHQLKHYKDAVHLYARIESGSDYYSEASYRQAEIYQSEQNYLQALPLYHRALRQFPEQYRYLLGLVKCLIRLQRFEEALEHGNKIVALKPEELEIYNIFGVAQLALGKPQLACDSFTRALECFPDSAYVHKNLGQALFKLDQLDKAAQSLELSVHLKPDFSEAYHLLGQIKLKQNKLEDARVNFGLAIKYQPDNLLAAQNLRDISQIWLEPLYGQRLLLRPANLQDAPFFMACYSDSDFMTNYNAQNKHQQNLDSVRKTLSHAENGHPSLRRNLQWVIVDRNNDRPIGLAALAAITMGHRRAEFLVGILNPADRKSGMALEATLLGCDFVFNHIQFNKLTAVVYDYNENAQKNALSFGFVKEGHLRGHSYSPVLKRYHGIYEYGLLSSDFYKNKRLKKLSLRLLGRDVTLRKT